MRFRLGSTSPAALAEAARTGVSVPSLHSSRFAPDVEPALKAGAASTTAALLELLKK